MGTVTQFDILGQKDLILIIRIIRAGTMLVRDSFNRKPIHFGYKLKLKELLTSVVPSRIILIVLFITKSW